MTKKTTIDVLEVAKFAQQATTWWNTEGPLKTLHDINPARIEFIRKFTTLTQQSVLDVGCGGGILSEGLAKRGAIVTGLDVEPEAIAAATGHALNIFLLWGLLFVAAVLGDTVNYWIGHYIGPRAFSGNSRFLKKEYLDKTQAFYDKHGGKTILLARFIPIIRTFAPFVAGIGRMRYGYFITYNIVGGILWTTLMTFMGYFFGNLEIVRNNFSLVVIAIIFISILPGIVEFFKGRKASPQAAPE